MLNTLILRNAKRSARDYLIYLITMAIISTLMFALNTMIFSSDINALFDEIPLFAIMIGMASVFIVFVIVWLIHYMVNFMLEKRSKEFGTYLLLGMEKKQIAQIFWRENMALGTVSMLIGVVPGYLFQKLFINIFYSIIKIEYHISAEVQPLGILLTIGILLLSYLLALMGVRRKFKKLYIRDFIYFDKKNEQTMTSNNKTRQTFLLLAAIAYIILFNVLVFTGSMNSLSVWGFIIGLLVAIYLLYIGLGSFFVSYIKAKPKALYKGSGLFVMRQLASKIRTMRFTLGTLTILFGLTLLTWTTVMMVADFQQTELDKQIPFDVAVFSDTPDNSFDEQLQVIEANATLTDLHRYNIYENNTSPVNDYLYAHVKGTWKNKLFVDGKMGNNTYFGYDTYMSLSDYNRIRSMLGYEEAVLYSGQYILHGKEKIDKQLRQLSQTIPVKVGSQTLKCREINMEALQQNRMNGADYIIVVPDELIQALTPYYSVMVGTLTDVASDLQGKLMNTLNYWYEPMEEDLYTIEMGEGSNQVLIVSENAMVADNLRISGSFTIVSLCFMLAYLGIVFLCAALTILTVQQLSDATKYRFRYRILKQLGMSKKEIERVVFKQLAVYYFCPFITSVLLSTFLGLFFSKQFVYYTGIPAADFQYYFLALAVFTAIYVGYFIISLVGFNRNLSGR